MWDTSVLVFTSAASKLFLSGAGWQVAAFLAENAGLSTASVGYGIIAGMGDALGVTVGASVLAVFEIVVLHVRNH